MKRSSELANSLFKHEKKLVKKLRENNLIIKKHLSKARKDILDLQEYLSEKEENEDQQQSTFMLNASFKRQLDKVKRDLIKLQEYLLDKEEEEF